MDEQKAPRVAAKIDDDPVLPPKGPTKGPTKVPPKTPPKAPPGKSSTLKIPASLPLTTDDPNFDPGWDWTVDESVDLFAKTERGDVPFTDERLPYFANSGPAANDFNSDIPGVRDILPEDGWVLLTRNFGTPDKGVPFPHFILYNRFRGLLRLFYFNPHFPEAFTYGVVTLQKQSASDAFALFTFTDTANATLSDFDPEGSEVFIGRLEPVVWNYADFVVAGYDPDLPDDAKFLFVLAGVRESEVSLEGDVTLDQVLDNANLVASKSGQLGQTVAIGEKIAGLFKSLIGVEDAVKASKGKDDEDFPDVSLAEMTSVISAGIAVFKFFLGGSKPKQTQVLKFKGDIDLSGTIRLPTAVGSILLRVPGARHLADTDLPFYDKPLGVFNLRSNPTIDLRVILEPAECRNTSGVGPKILTLPFPRRHQHRLKRPQVVINPHAGLKAEVEAAYVRREGKLEFETSSSDGYFALAEIPTVVDSFKGPADCDDAPPEIHPRRAAVRLTITPEEATPDFTPVTLVKIYPTEYTETSVEI